MKRTLTRWLFSLLLLVAAPTISFAQDGEPPEDGCDIYDGCPVPLDTWVIILVFGAVIYGFSKLNKQASTEKKDQYAKPPRKQPVQRQWSISQ